MDFKVQQATITSFRENEFNVLVSTNVGEEGLDITDCSCVLSYRELTHLVVNAILCSSFSPTIADAQSVTSFIQQKGRLLHNMSIPDANSINALDSGGFVFFSCDPAGDRKALEKIQIQQANMEAVAKLLMSDADWVIGMNGEKARYKPRATLKAKLDKLREERRPFLYDDADGVLSS
jgi:superfamily II DNA/RNA helicase